MTAAHTGLMLLLSTVIVYALLTFVALPAYSHAAEERPTCYQLPGGIIACCKKLASGRTVCCYRFPSGQVVCPR